MKRAALLLAAWVAACAHAACDVEYRLEPRWEAPRHFAATLAFDAGERTRTRIAVSPDWGGVTDFHRALRRFEGAALGVSVAEDGNAWVVTHPRGGRVALRYEVHGTVEADAGTLAARDFYRNLLGAGWFQVFGLAMLPVPESLAGAQARGCVAFDRLPAAWSFTSSLGDGGTGPGRVALEGPLAAVTRSVFVGGDFRILRREIAGKPLVFALRGGWGFEDARLADGAAAVIGAHREFWGDHDFPRYLVTLVPNRLASGSGGGTGVDGAFAMHASRDFSVPGRTFDFLIGHENLHAWIPSRIGGLEQGAGEAAGYWLSEGFTNYLTHRLLLRAGVWTLRDYAAAMNEVIFEAATSPVARARNERIRERFWKDDDVQRLPYLRGELVAVAFARLLERAGTSLEAVLRGLARSPGTGDGTAVERFTRAAARHVPATRALIEAYVERGEAIPLEVGSLGPCLEGAARSRVPFELGFERTRSFAERRLHGVLPGSAAHRAGVRDGMAIEGLSVAFGNVGREVVLQVREEGGAQREIRYLPRGEPVVVMQYAPPEGVEANAACARWLSP